MWRRCKRRESFSAVWTRRERKSGKKKKKRRNLVEDTCIRTYTHMHITRAVFFHVYFQTRRRKKVSVILERHQENVYRKTTAIFFFFCNSGNNITPEWNSHWCTCTFFFFELSHVAYRWRVIPGWNKRRNVDSNAINSKMGQKTTTTTTNKQTNSF